MRLGARPDNPLEWLVLRANLAPLPIVDTQLAFTMARAIQAAVELGVFEALAGGPLTAAEVARRCDTSANGTRALLHALVGCRYLAWRDGRYALTAVVRRWLLAESPRSLCDKLRLQQLEWEWLGRLEEFVRTGEPMDLHARLDARGWSAYQAGMAALGRVALDEVVLRTPVPPAAREMLDIGGSGGTYAAAFLRRYRDLSCTILDLPEAVAHAAQRVASHGLGDRLRIAAGDVLRQDLGARRYDVVFMSNLAHHLSVDDNRAVARKVARSLRRGGVFVLQDIARADEPSADLQLGALTDLYFALTSRSGTFAVGEMTRWLRAAGLVPGRPIWFRTAPGLVQVVGRRLR